jgi:hypothetical protein
MHLRVKAAVLVFSAIEALYIMNYILKARQLITIFFGGSETSACWGTKKAA